MARPRPRFEIECLGTNELWLTRFGESREPAAALLTASQVRTGRSLARLQTPSPSVFALLGVAKRSPR